MTFDNILLFKVALLTKLPDAMLTPNIEKEIELWKTRQENDAKKYLASMKYWWCPHCLKRFEEKEMRKKVGGKVALFYI